MERLLLITPPFTQVNCPYPATAYLKGYLERKGFPVDQFDLSIELIEEAGEKIGKSIAFLINIFNPEQVIIGGYLAGAGDYLMLPLKSAVNKYSLRLVYNDTLFRTTNLDDNIGSLGAAMLIRNKVISL